MRSTRWWSVVSVALFLSCGDTESGDPEKDDVERDAIETGTTPTDSGTEADDSGEEPGPGPDTSAPVDDSGSSPDTGEEPDRDGDGYTVSMGDCDDNDYRVHPGGREVCNLRDDDCDGVLDEDAWDAGTFFVDADGDGFGDWTATVRECAAPEGYVTDSTDCDDSDPATFPGSIETCDEIDNDCDGEVDEDAIDPTAYYLDADGDRYGDTTTEVWSCDSMRGWVELGGDCDDAVDTVHPEAVEFCDGIDNDCDGVVDTDATFGLRTWYADADSDGHGNSEVSVESCLPPSGYVWTSDDCDDTEAARYPTAVEFCDLLDNDCDDAVDEEDVCLSCDVDYPTPLTVVDAGTAGGDVDGGSAECYVSGYDYVCDECAGVSVPIGADGEVTGAYRSMSWVVTSGSASVSDASSLSTAVTLTGVSPEEPDECEEGTYALELRVEECDGTVQTDTISFTLSCCGTG